MALNAGLGTVTARLSLPDYPFIVIGVDPGGTTGISVFVVHEHEARQLRVEQWANNPEEQPTWYRLHEYAKWWRDGEGMEVVLVVEQFDKRPGVIDPDYSAMFITNDIRDYEHEFPVIWQIPAAAKNLIKPAKRGQADQLKRFGWYHPNYRHANDATRHVLVYLVEKIKHRPTILKGWPKR